MKSASSSASFILSTDRRDFLKLAAVASTVALTDTLSAHAADVRIPVKGLQAVTAWKRDATGVHVRLADGLLSLFVQSPRCIRVNFVPGAASAVPEPLETSFCVVHGPRKTAWKFHAGQTHLILSTAQIQARVDKKSGAVEFLDAAGKAFLTEPSDGKSMTPKMFKDVPTWKVRQDFRLAADEAIYGLGQHQRGLMNYRGTSVHLQQENMHVAIPVLISSRGYGILWDNPAITDVHIGISKPSAMKSRVVWESTVGPAINYYVMYGPELDEVIAEYRNLTGAAPMFGRWVWGFWQCKNRYRYQEQILGIPAEYRSLKIPMDGIVQDWRYWTPAAWGSNTFNPVRYPNPHAMISQLHHENIHFMISVWAKFVAGSANYELLTDAGVLYPDSGGTDPKWDPVARYYDAFNPLARKLYWGLLNKDLFALGVDAWWLDASELEVRPWGTFSDYKTHAGWGAFVFNAYPLMHTGSVYDGQRGVTSEKRVMILTRSAWAGQQRHAAITWSGDVEGKWEVLARQIPAGINFALSGIPYWNTDIGGYVSGNPQDPAYCELFIRWFQFGAFCPLFRVHGVNYPKEMWQFGQPAMAILEKFDRLRYHLLPYIYSVAWQVTSRGYTMLRGLIMDFRTDKKVHAIADQFMFGPGILVSPVTRPAAKTRKVYLPAGSAWYDFWTGKMLPGGKAIFAEAAISTMPLHVRAGTILPLGPASQSAMDRTAEMELRIYPGADGEFTLYDDEYDNYNYEKGTHATIRLTWNDQARSLTIGPRQGEFPGMIRRHTFRVVLVRPGHGAGLEPATPDAVVTHDGRPQVVKIA